MDEIWPALFSESNASSSRRWFNDEGVAAPLAAYPRGANMPILIGKDVLPPCPLSATGRAAGDEPRLALCECTKA